MGRYFKGVGKWWIANRRGFLFFTDSMKRLDDHLLATMPAKLVINPKIWMRGNIDAVNLW